MSLLLTGPKKAHKGLFAQDTAPPGYGPSQLQSAYNLSSSSAGSGQTVAVVDAYNDPDIASDLSTYRAQYGLPACTTASGCFQVVNQDGQASPLPPNAGSTGWDVEESLDVDMVSAACPNCKIILVEANSAQGSDLDTAENEAVTLGAKYVSNSWASCEASGDTAEDTYFDHPGTVITAAGGDNGYDNYQQGCTSPNYPAASQYVTSVGGTRLVPDSSTARGWAETTWSPDPDATGSGCSIEEPKPVWQTDTGCANRMTNDVSAVADPGSTAEPTGVAVYDSYSEGGWLPYGVGGTSAATPIIASVYALAGTPAAGSYPASYPYLNGYASGGLNDITSGTDYDAPCTPAYFCKAGPGYDGPTGLGTPNGVSAFAPVSYGTLSGTVTDAATGKPVAGATVTAGQFTGTTNSSGQYSFVAATGSYTVTAQAFGYVQQSASGVQVTSGHTSTQNFALTTAVGVTLSGTVTDGSGQGWPLLAKISISGDPNAAYTSPSTGDYSISVPGQASYTMTVTPLYPGYKTTAETVTIGTTNVQQNATATINTSTCKAPGYSLSSGKCSPVSGGLVAGVITDANTGKPVNGVTVTDAAKQSGTSKATADPALRGGFYWLFASPPGSTSLTAAGSGYQAATASAAVTSGAATQQNWSLDAGQLAITPGSVSATETLGQTATQKLTLTDNGSAPIQVSLGTQTGTFTPAGQPAAQARTRSVPFRMIKGHFTPGPAGMKALAKAEARAGAAPAAGKSGTGWSTIADYPIPICCNAAATDPQTGDVYSLTGSTTGTGSSSDTTKSYVYNPSANTWSPIAPTPQALYEPAAAFLDGKVYLIGGWGAAPDNNWSPSAAVYAYTPGSNTWSKVASLPTAEASSMAAVLGGQLYVVGGCTDTDTATVDCSAPSDAVYRYNPAANTWAQLANYPTPGGYGACAGIDSQVVCADGTGAPSATYLYDPVTNTWRRGADMPSAHGVGYWGMSYAGANGMLQIAGGVTNSNTAATNEAQEYNPVTNTWKLLPNTNYIAYQDAGACGFYQIGEGGGQGAPQVLPGYDQCDEAGDTLWLSVNDTQVTVPAGQSMTVSVRLDSAKVSQPGTYTAALWAATNTPYPVQSIPVTLQASPPSGWQEISGTVSGADGAPVVDATVALGSPSGGKAAATQTNGSGIYQWWLPGGRVQVSAAKDAYQPQAKMVTVKPDSPAAASFTLKPDPATSPYRPATSASPRSAAGSTSPGRPAATGKTAARASTVVGKASTKDVARACPVPKTGYMACMALVRTGTRKHKGIYPAQTTPPGYSPSDLQSAYNLPSATAGKGKTVAVVDAGDDPTAEADLATYRTQYGLPACTTADGCFQKVNQDGQQGNYPPNLGWGDEESLDLDMVSAACPNCHIILVESNKATIASLGRAEDEAVKLGAKYVSNSYGTAGETQQETQFNKYWDHPGVVITAASGDYGYNDEGENADSPSFPAVSPDVTAIGGTTLTRDPSTTRGWTETVWQSFTTNGQTTEGTGSGCSLYEPKPAWQQDTGCKNRTDNDVAAVADPNTPVAVYDSGDGGWIEEGGTSVATPIIAATYALAGTPKKGTNPASYPYLHATGLNDVTSGTNGPCAPAPAYLCTAGPGYDGPTGLGTPDGVTAFKPATYGTLTGTVTSASGPVAGAAVTADGLTATTSSTGSYALPVPPGTYTATATRYGDAASMASVEVTRGRATTQNFTLTVAAKQTATGTVTDGSGHGWPLYAKITIGGVPGAPARTYHTSPFTGRYSIRLPGQNTYTLTVTPDYPGYAVTTATVAIGTGRAQKNITVPVGILACLQAPGYTFGTTGGAYQDFTGWSGTTPQDGWTDTDNNNSGHPWQFNTYSDNPTGVGGYAIADPDANNQVAEDTSLVSPAFSLTGISSPAITFNTAALNVTGSFDASVDLSLDGGTTWQTVWQQTAVPDVQETDVPVSIPVPQAAGQPKVEVRFHFAGNGITWWAVGDVVVGSPSCTPIPGGLVAGVVTDANTGQPVNGITVASHGQSGTTTATGDSAVPGGYYWLFSRPGPVKLTTSGSRYVRTTASVRVAANMLTRHDWVLQAGQVTADAHSLSATETLGRSGTAKVTFRDGGAAPVHVAFGAQAGGFTPLTQAPSQSPPPRPAGETTGTAVSGARMTSGASGWASIPDVPAATVANAAAYDPRTGQVYSIGGGTGEDQGGGQDGFDCSENGGQTASGYVYNPPAKAWTPIAPLPQPLVSPAAAFLDGTLYVAGGFNCSQEPSAAVYAYTPGANTWSLAASLPTPLAGSAAAVLNGQLYVVGGCDGQSQSGESCFIGESQAVYRYNTATSSWTRLANYPVYGGVAFEACAGIDGELVCAGGTGSSIAGSPINTTFLFNPASNTWTQGAGMPYPNYQMSYTGADGKLQIAGGFTGGSGSISGQASQYDPVTNTWSSLPSLPNPESGGGGACGMYVVGGSPNWRTAEILPGYNQCNGAGDTGWLPTPRGFTLQPGQSVTVDVTLDAGKVDQPGTYTADLWAAANTPYPNTVIPVTLTVKPPAGWGLLSGTVTSTKGKPVAGATVQVDTTCTTGDYCGKQSYTLTAAADGSWQWWLPASDNNLLVIAAKDGYIQQVTHTHVAGGKAQTLNYILQNYKPPMH
jgi:subtilase family serine protease/N-acetylneuraminic acid mutarotase